MQIILLDTLRLADQRAGGLRQLLLLVEVGERGVEAGGVDAQVPLLAMLIVIRSGLRRDASRLQARLARKRKPLPSTSATKVVGPFAISLPVGVAIRRAAPSPGRSDPPVAPGSKRRISGVASRWG